MTQALILGAKQTARQSKIQKNKMIKPYMKIKTFCSLVIRETNSPGKVVSILACTQITFIHSPIEMKMIERQGFC